MSEYSSLKATINASVKTNGNQEITGSIMNSVLNAMVDSLGTGYQFIGVATPTNPGSAQTPDYKCFYIATTPGKYTNLGGLVVADGEVALLKWDSAWTKEVTGAATADKLNQFAQRYEIGYTDPVVGIASCIVELYLYGNGIDRTHAYVLDRVDRQNVGNWWRFFIKDATTDTIVIAYSAKEEVSGIINLQPNENSNIFGKVIINWEKVPAGQANINLGIILTYKAFNLDYSKLLTINPSIVESNSKLLSCAENWQLGGINSSNGKYNVQHDSAISTKDFWTAQKEMTASNFNIVSNIYFNSIEVVFFGYDKNFNYVGNSVSTGSCEFLINTYPSVKWVKVRLIFRLNNAVISPSINYVEYIDFNGIGNPALADINKKITDTDINIGDFRNVEKDGYLNSNGVYENEEYYHSLNTDYIPCKEGDVFLYRGAGYASAVSWIFYNGTTKVSSGQYTSSGSDYTLVTIPQNVDNVIFSSFKRQGTGDIIFDVARYGSIKARMMKNEVSIANSSPDILKGKKWVACGDSFTQGDFNGMSESDYKFQDEPYLGSNKVYPFYIGRRCGMTIVNEAISGSTMTYVGGNRSEFSTPNGRYTQIPADADYITLYFGINDQAYAAGHLGTINDTTNETFYGAWNIVMQYLIEHHPNAKIGIIITNGTMEGSTMVEWTNAERAIAKKWGVAFLDLNSAECPYFLRQWDKPDITPVMARMRDNHFKVGNNNNHPNPQCHEYESTIIENWLRSL